MQHVSLTRVVGPLALTTLTTLWWAGCSDTAGPRWVQTVRPVPDTVNLVPGETAVFGVKVLDQNGEDLSAEWAPRVKWSIYDPTVATLQVLDVGASVTALEPGTAFVRAELGRGQRAARAYIQPPGLDRIEIEPSPVMVSLAATFARATARLLDSTGAEMSPYGFRLSWKIADTTVIWPKRFVVRNPFINLSGRKVGQTEVSLIVGDTVVHADVFVISEPLTPSAPSVNTVSSSSLEVIWGSIKGAYDGYRLYRSVSVGGTYTHIASPGSGFPWAYNDTTYVDTGLSPSTTYFFQVEACHRERGCSERSAPGSGTTASGG